MGKRKRDQQQQQQQHGVVQGKDGRKDDEQGVSQPDQWQGTLESLARRIRNSDEKELVVVTACGAKGLGKSTFLRRLARELNKSGSILTTYLDTDLGQPERGVPGVVSLAKGESRSSKLEYAIFLGDNSAAIQPVTYLDACRQLVKRHHEQSHKKKQQQVLIVNTHGWNIGLGAELVREICKSAGVTHAVHLTHESRPDDVDPRSWDCPTLKKIYSLKGVITNAAYSPAEERFLRMCKYFEAPNLAAIEAAVPICVHADKVKFIQMACEHYKHIDQDWLMNSSKGCIVGLCRLDPDSHLFEFCAMGIVRSVAGKNVHIVAPVSPAQLDSFGVDHLVLGSQETPLARWQQADNDAVRNDKKPFFALPEQSLFITSDPRKNTRNLKRKRLMRRKV